MRLQLAILAMVLGALLSACVAPLPTAPAEPAASAASAQDDDHGHDHDHDHDHAASATEELGEVTFPISCTPEAQAEFNHGMAYLHTFWFSQAIESFDAVAQLDPTCAMAHWGKAMSMLGIPWSPASEQTLVDGWTVVEQANALDAPTPREQAYIAAITTMYQDPATRDHATRTSAYEAAMAQLAQDNPDDMEAQIFHALALNIIAPPTDKTYANQLKAAAILEPLFTSNPEHPGVAHYLIHSYDYPSLAGEGLNAALRFAEIAPSAPHALHMPAHIFTRLGYWQESIATNMASAEAAKAGLAERYPPQTGFVDALHAMDYMMYGYLQTAQDAAAKALVDEISALEAVDAENLGSAYALAAMPARYVLERGEWPEGSALALHPANLAWERFPQAEAALVFARGLSAARLGDVEAATQELEHLQTLRANLEAANQAYWAEQTHIQMEELSAWIAFVQGDHETALSTMRAAVALEAATEKHPVTPGPIVPANELLGEMLLELGNPQEALAAFEASLQDDPNRFRSVYGAAHAAELAGEAEAAQSLYEELLAMSVGNGRAELAAATTFLAQ